MLVEDFNLKPFEKISDIRVTALNIDKNINWLYNDGEKRSTATSG